MEFPDYDEIEEYITNGSRFYDYFDSWSEYSATNHERMRHIFFVLSTFEHNGNQWMRAVRDIGQSIHDEGGLQAMQGCFNIFCAALRVIRGRLPPSENRVKELHCVLMCLKQMWNGVGDWKN